MVINFSEYKILPKYLFEDGDERLILRIYDGPDIHSPVLLDLDNNDLKPDLIISSGGVVVLYFILDWRVNLIANYKFSELVDHIISD